MRDTVQAEVIMTFLVSEELSFRIPVELAYDSSDPYAVKFTFHLPGDAPVTWAFARELLLDGLSQPSGEGDVHIAPASAQHLSDVFIRLQVGGEGALFRAGAAPLVAFLDRTDRVAPLGEERSVADFDYDLAAALESILAGNTEGQNAG
ncbi:SsgA family sporulation/cell division regulator [Streptomyces mobaraensis NBRC 13819 = DSM 40847]|uniref:SsgA family sporulation/cell division regulator n=2 Tax=Streptomyces mobaraensis TaxID=35621 RepID=A0A5N5WC71_STRMB|nr:MULTISPECIES: SsgA family sporulation/cell division regulator [Streptomyces]EME98795.1 SsgA-like sporulation/cell division regulator [Streptomyces mobaraensis NBRC 13819 = DSM 40847]KAB7848481.1 SsgA family sporulation/cell division regulator [Streptomyces mobaraensis]MBC2873755.1 SsgA family sporulation/cell division regulator [Streptomyces sp. TYQ1024]QTT74765.1 SsgA family sporulation/cell division regulator [Streptomyces mobaraensis NBRC 13819 = DSM 40847]UBI37820.1 SsgA family sporulat